VEKNLNPEATSSRSDYSSLRGSKRRGSVIISYLLGGAQPSEKKKEGEVRNTCNNSCSPRPARGNEKNVREAEFRTLGKKTQIGGNEKGPFTVEDS